MTGENRLASGQIRCPIEVDICNQDQGNPAAAGRGNMWICIPFGTPSSVTIGCITQFLAPNIPHFMYSIQQKKSFDCGPMWYHDIYKTQNTNPHHFGPSHPQVLSNWNPLASCCATWSASRPPSMPGFSPGVGISAHETVHLVWPWGLVFFGENDLGWSRLYLWYVRVTRHGPTLN